ncbi:helix-turn-helix transcriptional regulator [Streptomyces xanthochromogenes]|uniref:helix-turn-helix domain-containing protein n=1 Tax=Streptomyces xanthochromogenes TaxID=67384 RepID=UPI002F40F323
MSEDEQRRARPAAQYGPTAATVAHNVLRLRKRRELSIYQLSAKLREAGRAITPAAVGKIERQQRQVTVDDLMALAVILGVSPASLLLPQDDSPTRTVEVTGAGEVPADTAWEWASNKRPLRLPEDQKKRIMLEYRLFALPGGLAGLVEEAMPMNYIKGGVRYDGATGLPIEGGDDGASLD